MSVSDNRAMFEARRSRGVRTVVASAAVVFAGFAVIGALAVVYAVGGFAVVAVVAIFALRDNGDIQRLIQPVTVAQRTGDPLRAVVAGLPDPVIALDSEGRVLALMSTPAPWLRRCVRASRCRWLCACRN